MYSDFKTTTNAKWILIGEHAVLRGHPALVFPLKSHRLILNYEKNYANLDGNFSGIHGSNMGLLFWSVLQHGHQLLNLSINSLSGLFHIDNSIPIGTGLGASAALCVAMARWFASQKLILEDKILEFARELEHLFHGQSSGLDIAGVTTENGIFFKNGTYEIIKPGWQPKWYLSSCGQLGITSHCIEQVLDLWKTNSNLAKDLDNMMGAATIKARHALLHYHESPYTELSQAIKMAADCFRQWGLVSETLAQHLHLLQKSGALAAKPTGSGNGGFVVSLWQNPPPNSLLRNMIYLS